MTRFLEFFAALAYPFADGEVKVIPKAGGQPYITARTAMNRLDEVCGPEGWRDEYLVGKDSVICRLSIRLPDGEWLTKVDAGGYSATGREEDDSKGGVSDSFKRACVKFGIARYLYRDGVPGFVMEPADARRRGIVLHRVGLSPSDVGSTPAHLGASVEQMEPPAPPVDDVPGFAAEDRSSAAGLAAEYGPAPASPSPLGRQPCSGKELWGWANRKGTETGQDVVGMLKEWSRANGHSGRVLDWDIGLVSEAFAALAARMDAAGLLDLPPAARDQMPAPRTPRPGPLTIEPKDPAKNIKLKIKELAKDLCSGVLGKGQVPTEAQVMAWLAARCVQHGLPALSSVRNVHDRKALEMVLSKLYEDAADVQRLS